MDSASDPTSSGSTDETGDGLPGRPSADPDADPGAVEGRVVDGNGEPIAGATVAISSSTRPTRDLAALTTDDGRFRLGNLLAGTYSVEARQGTSAGQIEVAVEAGRPASVEIQLGGG